MIKRCNEVNIPIIIGCTFVDLNRSLFYYHQRKPKIVEDINLVTKINKIRENYGNLGAKKLAKLLSNTVEKVNHKRIARILKENNLTVKIKKRKRIRDINVVRLPLPVKVEKTNELWSIDFMCSRKQNAFKFMLLNIVDVHSRINPGMFLEKSFTSFDVTYELEEAIKKYGKPLGILTDNGTEFTSGHFRVWCKRNNIAHFLTNKGKPSENSYVESFNSSVRREILDENDFESIKQLRKKITKWRNFYNKERPHGSLQYLSPEHNLRKMSVQI